MSGIEAVIPTIALYTGGQKFGILTLISISLKNK